MTVPATQRRAGPYLGNGVATSFAFAFKVFADTDLRVVQLDTVLGVESDLVLNSDYTVTINPDQESTPGGTVTTSVAPSSDERITIIGNLDYDQPTDLPDGGNYRAQQVENALDRLGMLLQQLDEKIERAVRLTASASFDVDAELPPPLPYALIGWNEDGTGLRNADVAYSTALATDLASADTGKGSAMVGFVQAGAGAVARTLQAKARDTINVRDFGAVGDGVANDGPAIAAALAQALSLGAELVFPEGTFSVVGAEFVVSSPLKIRGAGRTRTRIVFSGSPAKAVRTYAVWRSEYDSANYSASSDDAIACGFVISSHQVFISDMNIQAYWDAALNHPLPFDSATDYPTSEYDVGILIQKGDVSLERLLVNGPWGSATNTATGAIKIDASQPVGPAPEHIKIHDCEAYGRWGLVIEGAHGSGPAPNYADLDADDTRGTGGISDLLCVGSQFYDTSGNNGVRITIDNVPGRRVRRFSSNSGGMFIDGQLASNTAKRFQQITFVRCRFASVDPYAYYLNYINRVEFIGCHSEFKSGFLMTDGVTPVTSSDVSVTTTVNARKITYIGGEKSGEVDARTLTDSVNNLRLVTEWGFDNGGRGLVADWLPLQGNWTPTITFAASGTPTYSVQYGRYTRIGDLVHVWGRITLSSKDSGSGAASIAGLPFTVANHSSNYDPSITIGAHAGVTVGTGGIGGLANNNTKSISLTKLVSGGAIGNLQASDLTDTSRIDFHCVYMTSDA